MAHILIIDDEREFSEALQSVLEDLHHTVEWVESANRATSLPYDPFDVVLLDNRMPGMSGLEFLKALREQDFRIPVILMTNLGTSETIMEAMEFGAFDYLEKPLELDDLIAELDPMLQEAIRLRPSRTMNLARPPECETSMLGKSKPMMGLYKEIGQIAKTELPVLIRGETGTGKELVARAVHDHSPRKDKPFVALNCASLNENLLHDELFGHVKGAFTGAEKLRKGRFEYAHQGTIFLDEIGDMPSELQTSLLRVLEDKKVHRLGAEADEAIPVDVRILSATHQDLEAAVKEGQFREDLFFRLNGTTLSLPPLREREADIELLARHFLADEAAKANRPMPTLNKSSLERLMKYSWPGNVRELQFTMRRAVQKCRGLQILPDDLELASRFAMEQHETAPHADLMQVVKWAWDSEEPELWRMLSAMLEKSLIEHALEKCEGNKTEVHRRLGVSRGYVIKRIAEFGLE